QLGAVCRERNVLLLADAVQSVGLLETDVEALGIDALAVSTQKGLLGLYGLGFLYCRASWADRLEPAYLARFAVDLGDAHEAATGGDDYQLAPGARRFEIGNYNFAGAIAAQASLALLQQLSSASIEQHVRRLSTRLAGGFFELGLPLIGPATGPERGSMVCIGDLGAGGHDSVDNPTMGSLHAYLRENNVCLSIRRGLLRFSLHAYNNEADVDAVIDLAREWTRVRAKSEG
ncbi:MAG: aminotransferase class V-fold PLP-dependent enzyme, partial [Chromatiales bacterium]|nr:aminotransferase class V-fold PLP-dependent enzyme [Chromatiales bacterium]